MSPSDMILLYVTCRDALEARAIATSLLDKRLVACANIIPQIESIYEWNGSIESGSEALLLLKTTQKQSDTATQIIKALHSYQCPCITQLPITGGNPDFLTWITAQTQSS